MPTQYGYAPQLDQVKPGDSIYFNKNVTSQHPNLLEMFKQNAATNIYGNTGSPIGVEITKQPLTYNTQAALSAPQYSTLDQAPQYQQPQQAQYQQAPQAPTQPQQSSQGQVLPVNIGQTNEEVAQAAGYASAADARKAGLSFVDSGQMAVEKAQLTNPATGVTPQDVTTADNAGANDPGTAFGLQDVYNAIIGKDTQIESETGKQQLLDAQAQSLANIEAAYQAQLEALKQQEAAAIQETKDVGGRTSGTLKRLLGRAGGFTTSAGAVATMTQANNLSNSIQKIKDKVSQLKAQAAADAASEKGKINVDTAKEIRSLQNDLVTQQNSKARLLLDLMTEVRQAKKDAEVKDFFTGSNIISLMKEIPAGVTQQISDPNTGKLYTITGTKDPDTVQVTDDAGTLRVINKLTGDVISSVAGVGKTKSIASGSSSVGSDTDRQNIQQKIAAIRGSDGYIDTAKYAVERENVAVNNPKLLSWFDNTYKPEDVLNPNDPTAKKYFQTAAQQGKGEQPTDINSILDQYKAQGYSKKDIETIAKNKYGTIPDVIAVWIKNNY